MLGPIQSNPAKSETVVLNMRISAISSLPGGVRIMLWMVLASLLLHLGLLFMPPLDFSLPRPGKATTLDAELVAVLKASIGEPPATAAKVSDSRPVSAPEAAAVAPAAVAAAPAEAASTEAEADVSETVPAETAEAAPATAPPPESPAAPHAPLHLTITFSLFKGADGMKVGRVIHNWEIKDGRYLISSVAEATGAFAMLTNELVVQNSQGRITASGLAPESYWEQRGQKPDRTFNAQFDYENKTLTYGRLSQPATVPLLPGAQDQLSFIYQLGLQAPFSGTVQFPMTTGRKLRSYSCEVVGEAHIATGVGELRTLHIAKIRKQPGDDGVEIWLAADHQYLPVKVRFTNSDGGVVEMVVEGIEKQ